MTIAVAGGSGEDRHRKKKLKQKKNGEAIQVECPYCVEDNGYVCKRTKCPLDGKNYTCYNCVHYPSGKTPLSD